MKKTIILKVVLTITVILLPTFASSQETYKFERMWPTLKQPWYFYNPRGMAVDSSGFVYVADTANNRIQVFSSDGTFVTTWGSYGTGDGELDDPRGMAVDSSGFVYVAELYTNRIQKFSSDGTFINKWGNYCNLSTGEGCVDPDGDGPLESSDGEFYTPRGIAVDSSGFVYVGDAMNCRIQKFSPDGTFITKWGSCGTGGGEFYTSTGIAVDSSGFVYVSDTYNHRIQKFSSDGTFITQWGSYGSGDGEFIWPSYIAIDSSGFVYVTFFLNTLLFSLSIIAT